MGNDAANFFSRQEQEDIKQAILNAELDTSGEIRVHIENTVGGDVLDRAAFIFRQLGMDKTEQRNGVLLYLAIRNRRFAIIGDKEINRVVPADFWDGIKANMLNNFRENHFTEGLIEAISAAGHQLKSHFPRQRDDRNELSDEVSFG